MTPEEQKPSGGKNQVLKHEIILGKPGRSAVLLQELFVFLYFSSQVFTNSNFFRFVQFINTLFYNCTLTDCELFVIESHNPLLPQVPD